ncbi:MAG TPA: DUF1565 domain-containing protein, partial [Lacipirellulaceae bacterium]
MQRPRRFQSQLILTGLLLTLCAERSLAQPATAQPAIGPQAVPPANIFVDDDNAGPQDGSPLHPYRTVQQAIDAAQNQAVIAVATGTYPQNIRVQEKAVRLYGAYVGGTQASYAGGTA